MAAGGRKLIFWKHLSNPDEHQVLRVGSHELHPAEADAGVTASVIREDDLIRRQRDLEACREEYERAWRTVTDDPKRRGSIGLAEYR